MFRPSVQSEVSKYSIKIVLNQNNNIHFHVRAGDSYVRMRTLSAVSKQSIYMPLKALAMHVLSTESMKTFPKCGSTSFHCIPFMYFFSQCRLLCHNRPNPIFVHSAYPLGLGRYPLGLGQDRRGMSYEGFRFGQDIHFFVLISFTKISRVYKNGVGPDI